MSKPSICISFDYEHDNTYRNLMSAWDKNKQIDFSIDDTTPDEISSNDISRIKAVLTTKIKEANGLVVISGKYINSKHKDSSQIGCVNWQNWECEKALELCKSIILIKLDSTCAVPEKIYGKNRTDIIGFDEDEIIKAINKMC